MSLTKFEASNPPRALSALWQPMHFSRKSGRTWSVKLIFAGSAAVEELHHGGTEDTEKVRKAAKIQVAFLFIFLSSVSSVPPWCKSS